MSTNSLASCRTGSLIGAYGLRITGVAQAAALLGRAAPDWPRLELVRRVAPKGAGYDRLGPDSALLRLVDDGQVLIERVSGRATFTTPRPLSDDELVHPYLGLAAAVFSRWLGRESFHGGAFVSGGGAWILAGDKGAGKSAILASLALRGLSVLADDVVVVERGRALAGPRSIDLRADTAGALGVGENLTVAHGRERWRMRLSAAETVLPIRGWVFPAWGEGPPTLLPIAPHERLVRLAGSRVLRIAPEQPEVLVELAALPAWEFRRSRSWDHFPDALDRLLATLDG
jgi:hypothetical protein